ncbi:MAG: DUF11 domain-containing protein [Thermoleophilia bacterium]|nr:DUF11 domain-containing protein [Thermoleophilia bacterium]
MPARPRSSRIRLALGAAALAVPAALAGTAAGAPGDLQPLTVEAKPAAGRYTLVNTWRVDRWAAPRAGWDKKDQSVAVDYTVKVAKRSKATDVTATGSIVITNPNATTPFTYSVSDALPGGECQVVRTHAQESPAAAGEVLPETPVIAGGATAEWTWTCTLEALPKEVIYDTVTVKFAPQAPGATAAAAPDTTALGIAAPSPLPGSASTTVPVDLANAPHVDVDPAVKVTDTLDGDQTRPLADALQEGRTFRYRRYLSFWRMKKACRTWANVAKITPAVVPVEPAAAPAALQAPDVTASEWVRTATASVKVCPPPTPEKAKTDPQPPKVEVTGPGATATDPVPVVPADNPRAPVVKDDRSKGRLLVATSADRTRAAVGDLITWRISVRNTGTAELYGVRLADVLPRQLVLVTTEASRSAGTAIGALAPGQERVVTLTTRVTGRPAPTPAAVARTRRIAVAKERDEALRRLRRGVVCNSARASARKAASHGDVACVRIVKRRATD